MIEIGYNWTVSMEELERGPIAGPTTTSREAADAVEPIVEEYATRLQQTLRGVVRTTVDAEPGDLLPGAVRVHVEVLAPDSADEEILRRTVDHVYVDMHDEVPTGGGDDDAE